MTDDFKKTLTQMGAKLSKLSLDIFEFFNEIFVAAGAGILGFGVLIVNGFTSQNFIFTFLVVSLAVLIIFYSYQTCERAAPSKNKIVLITGCDSGLGFSLAQEVCDLGFYVIAGCLNLQSEGAKKLEFLYGAKIKRVQLDITKKESIENAVAQTEKLLASDTENVFWALINNAGKMTFAEFEWLTEDLIKNEININLIGTCLITKAFCPLLRKYKGRVINISSHCAKATLPGLALYGATKTALCAWSDGIRVELNKYGVKVIKFIPGNFSNQTHIMANHVDKVYEMQKHFTAEQKEFYGDYFKRYNSYLSCISFPEKVSKIKDDELYATFEQALTDQPPRAEYIKESFRYAIYHKIFRFAPYTLRDKAILRFMAMPDFDSSSTPSPEIEC